MVTRLSYQGLRCVLEHLEASRRFHITARSPVLQKFEKSIPLRVSYFHLDRRFVSVNNVRIEVDYDKVGFKNNGEEVCKRKIPRKRKHQQELGYPIKTMYKYFLDGRSSILVDRLEIYEEVKKLNFSGNLKIQVNQLDTDYHEFSQYLPFIDSKCFPLKKLRTAINGPEDFDHPVINSPECLALGFFWEFFSVSVSDIDKMQSKTVILEYEGLDYVKVVDLVKHWRKNGKKVGTTFLYPRHSAEVINIYLARVNEELEEFRNDLEGVSEKFIPDSSRFSIPIDGNAKIIIYGVEVSDRSKDRFELVVKVVSNDISN